MTGVVNSYRDLQVWKRGMELVAEVHSITRRFPPDERFGLTSQLRRAAVSVPSNIAEGHGRSSTGDYLRHLSIAKGSVMEVETQLQIAEMLEYVAADDCTLAHLATAEIRRMLSALMRSLQARVAGRGSRRP